MVGRENAGLHCSKTKMTFRCCELHSGYFEGGIESHSGAGAFDHVAQTIGARNVASNYI